MSKTWKAHEKRTARRLSGTRTGNTGTAVADVTAGPWAVECKSRRELPAWLLDAMTQAKRNAGSSQTGIVVLHQVGQRSDNDIVCMAMRDFSRLAETINTNDEGSKEP